MPAVASIALLFVAAGLLVLAGAGLGRARGGAVRSSDTALMAVMTGIAVAFLLLVMPVLPLALFPASIATILLVRWTVDRRWMPIGAFLVGAGGLIVVSQVLARINDLADDAVSIPGWSPLPLAIGVAAVIVGVTLGIVGRAEERRG